MTTPVKQGIEFRLNAITSGQQTDADVAVLSDGRFVVTWVDGSLPNPYGQGAGIRAQIFNVDGSLASSSIVVAAPDTGMFNAYLSPSAAALSNGEFALGYIYWDEFNIRQPFLASVYDAQGIRRSTTQINDDFFDIVLHADLAGGQFAAVYEWRDTIQLKLYSSAGSEVAGPATADLTTGHDQTRPSADALGDGGGVAVWQETYFVGSTLYTDVRAQAFDETGAFLGTSLLAHRPALPG